MSQSKNMTSMVATLQIVSILLLMAGVFMLMVGGSRAFEAYTSQSWPTISGKITKSRVTSRRDSADNRTYSPDIEYEFMLDGDYYWGQRIRFDPEPDSDNRAMAEARVEAYPKESAVEIYYNPNRPERSMLEPSFSMVKVIYPAVGLIVFVAGLGLRMRTRSN